MVEIASAATTAILEAAKDVAVEGTTEVVKSIAKEVGTDFFNELPKELIEEDLQGIPKEVNHIEHNIEKLTNAYLKDLKEKADLPQTIPDNPFDSRDLQRRIPEENEKARKEFQAKKDSLILEWEKINGQKWPVYEKEVYNKYGEVIRKPGWKHDAHHIKPLSMGGANEAKNITPLHFEKHAEVHEKGSAYDKLLNELKG